jgi:hypothetical protein
MRRIIEIYRTFGEVVIWQDGRLIPSGRVEMTRAGLTTALCCLVQIASQPPVCGPIDQFRPMRIAASSVPHRLQQCLNCAGSSIVAK